MPKNHHVPAPRMHAAPPPPAELAQRIRTRAYELYVERNSEPGHDLDDWLRAEQELAGPAAKRDQ